MKSKEQRIKEEVEDFLRAFPRRMTGVYMVLRLTKILGQDVWVPAEHVDTLEEAIHRLEERPYEFSRVVEVLPVRMQASLTPNDPDWGQAAPPEAE